MLKEMQNTYSDSISYRIQYLADKLACILETLRRWMASKS